MYYHDSGNSRAFYQRIPIALDGHCQFRAVLHCANEGDEEATSDAAVGKLRGIVAMAGEKEGEENSARHRQWVEAELGEEVSERVKEVSTYWKEVRSGKSWGDHRCLPLLATHFNMPIYVYKPLTQPDKSAAHARPLRASALTHHFREPVLPDGFDSSQPTFLTINLLWIDNERNEEIKHQGHYDALMHVVTVELDHNEIHEPPTNTNVSSSSASNSPLSSSSLPSPTIDSLALSTPSPPNNTSHTAVVATSDTPSLSSYDAAIVPKPDPDNDKFYDHDSPKKDSDKGKESVDDETERR